MIDIWEGKIPGYIEGVDDLAPALEPYIIKGQGLKAAVMICPGGGYSHRANHEGVDIARWLNSLGLSAFVLHYRVAPYSYPYPVLDAKRAVRYIRYYARNWLIDTNKICVMGFSAGGHLTSMLGNDFDYGNSDSNDPIERESCRPDAMVLSYPVISFGKYTHRGSRDNLLANNLSDEMIRKFSSEKNVKAGTPPTFIWHTANDNAVPVENTLLFAKALSNAGIPFEAHIFPEGRHGLGMANEKEDVAIWTELCVKWLANNGFIRD
ncbi:MAG: alpha/beta hydrolase [bacterium]